MQYRTLGHSDLEVSEISLGSWLTFAGGVGLEQTRACTEAAFDAGITFFDTANIYGRGASEEAWGQILPSHPRDSYVLATKVWGQMSDDPADQGLSPAQIAKQIDASLTRLNVDHVDLYQAHRFDPAVPLEDTLEALAQVVADGKARYLGFSEWSPEQVRAGLEVAPDLFVSSQPQYSMLWQAPEDELFDACRPAGISHVVWSPLGQGVLTGKYRPGHAFPADSRFGGTSMANVAMDLVMNDASLAAVERLRPIADDAGLSLTHLALAWVLRRPEVASAIIGASRPEQVHDNAAASGVTLADDVLAAIDVALGDAPVRTTTPAPVRDRGGDPTRRDGVLTSRAWQT